MSIVVFHIEHTGSESVPRHAEFKDSELSLALNHCESLRGRMGQVSHVVISSELSDMVGRPGVAAVVDGKTPDGQAYDWSKSGRAGRFKASDITKTHKKADNQ